MIGRYLALLTPEEEDRILTEHMQPGNYAAPCLVGAVYGFGPHTNYREIHGIVRDNFERQKKVVLHYDPSVRVEHRYDELCDRFGTDKINALIRNRILRHRVQRVLAGAPVGVTP